MSLDSIYSDIDFEMDLEDSSVWKKDTSSDDESNCTDSELWLCKSQKKLSQRSKKLSQKQKSSRNSIGDETLYANSNTVADVLIYTHTLRSYDYK